MHFSSALSWLLKNYHGVATQQGFLQRSPLILLDLGMWVLSYLYGVRSSMAVRPFEEKHFYFAFLTQKVGFVI